MKDNTKITLTIGQLKKLVKESDSGSKEIYESLDNAVNALRSTLSMMDEDDIETRDLLNDALHNAKEARKIYYKRYGNEGILDDPRSLYPHKLVKESDWNRFVKQCNVEFMLTPEIKKAVEKYVMFKWKARNGEKDFLSSREIYDLVKFLKDKDILVGDDDVRIGEKKVAEIEHNYSSHRRDLEYKELKPKVRWLGIDLDLKPIDPDALKQ